MIKHRVLGLVLLLGLVACGQRPEVTPTLTVAATVEVAAATPIPPSATPSPLPTPTPIPSTTPTVTPIPPITVSAEVGIPEELIAAAQTLTTAHPTQFTWLTDPTQAELVLAVLPATESNAPRNTHHVLATWIYALVAPFPTIPDELPLAEVQQAWQEGTLTVDPATQAVLQAWWGESNAAALPIPSEQLIAALWENRPAWGIVPFPALDPQLKVMRPDGQPSPIDLEFDPATYPLAVQVEVRGGDDAAATFLSLWDGPTTNRDDDRITHLAMTGPAGFSRATAVRMERHGIQYPGEEVAPLLRAVDLAHMSHENPFVTDCPPPEPTGGTTFCANDRYIELMAYMGIDINEMTGNHLNDWGEPNLQHTFDLFESYGIQTFGGGRDIEHARQPLLIEHNGNRLAFVGCNPVGPSYDWAREDYAGSLPCDDYTFIHNLISQLDAQGYIVISTLQFLEHFMYEVWAEQRQAFDGLANAGADVVSGSQGHHPQAFNFVNGGFVHYGLGNFMADQMWSIPTRQQFIDIYTIYEGRVLSVQLWTGMIEDYGRPRPMTPTEREELLRLVFEASGW